MKVKLQCAACSARCSGKIPDGTRQVKCPKCGVPIVVPTQAPAEEEFYVDEILDDSNVKIAAGPPPELPVVVPIPDDEDDIPEIDAEEVDERRGKKWELLTPREFGLFPRSITAGLVYRICDAKTDEVLGRATEKVDAGKALVGFLVGRQMMEGTIAVTDEDTGRAAMVIERTNFKQSLILGATPCKVKLRDHRDDVLAKFSVGKPWFGGIALDFDADCTVFDADKNKWAVAKGAKVRNPDYSFRDNDGKKLARVRGKGTTNGFLAKASSWTGKGGWLKISIADDFDASPAEKLMILGTVIAIEFIITTISETKPGHIRLA